MEIQWLFLWEKLWKTMAITLKHNDTRWFCKKNIVQFRDDTESYEAALSRTVPASIRIYPYNLTAYCSMSAAPASTGINLHLWSYIQCRLYIHPYISTKGDISTVVCFSVRLLTTSIPTNIVCWAGPTREVTDTAVLGSCRWYMVKCWGKVLLNRF